MTYQAVSSQPLRDASGQIRLGASEKLVTNSYSSENGPSLISLRGTSHCQCCQLLRVEDKDPFPVSPVAFYEQNSG